MSDIRVLNGAIIGFGFISSKGHMPAYQERMKQVGDVSIIAVCDICFERKMHIPDGVRFYSDYVELIKNEYMNLDFVDISTHPADHYKIAKMAIEFGLNVLCEKPLTISIEDSRNLIQLAIQSRKVLYPCHNYKFSPVINSVREILKSKIIGIVQAVTIQTFRNTHAIGTEEWIPDWRRIKELSGGGIAMDHGSHSLYLAFEWLNGFPKSVSASSQNFSFDKYDTEDNFSALYEFEKGIANIYLSWTAGVRKVIYTIQGDKGAITVEDDQIQTSYMIPSSSSNINHKADWKTITSIAPSDWMDSGHKTWFNSLFDEFKKTIVENNFQNKELVNAFCCVQSILKAYESIDKNSSKIKFENNFL
jgi:predicted dehydrogenase